MYMKSSICGIQHMSQFFFIFLIITKIECWPVFKQDPLDNCIYSITLLISIHTRINLKLQLLITLIIINYY